jgi:hypothetical protein
MKRIETNGESEDSRADLEDSAFVFIRFIRWQLPPLLFRFIRAIRRQKNPSLS